MAWPGFAVHGYKELPGVVGNLGKQNLQIFISMMVLYRNSKICFHKSMVTGDVTKVIRARWHAY